MKLLLLMSMGCFAWGADPDWPQVEQHAVEFLQQYIRIQTIDPPANTAPAAALFKAELERNGFSPKVYTSGPNGQTNLVVRLKGRDSSKKPLLLLNHFDVVPVDAKAWDIEPFGGLIKDGFIWGRGTLDMKGIGVQQLTALIQLKKSGIVPPRDIVMLSTADEEMSGVYGIQWMIANHLDDIDCEYVLDEGGMGTRDVLAPGKLVFGISVGDKVILWLRVRAKGIAGHGSQPIADNANVILLHAVENALKLPAESGKVNAVVQQMRDNVGTFAENKFTSAIQRNTMSLTTLQSGQMKSNVIPSTSEATLDCRLLPGTNKDEFISDIKARINDRRVTIEVLANNPDPGASSSNTALFRALGRAFLKSNPGAIVTPMLVPFGTDSQRLQVRGVTAYGFTPMVLDAGTAATMHSDRERIPLAEFRKGVRIYYDALAGQW